MLTQIFCICNELQVKLLTHLSDQVEFITSNSTYNKVFSDNKARSDIGIIVLAETKWETSRYYSRFYGVELVFELRVKFDLPCPIIFTSHNPNFFDQLINSEHPFMNKEQTRVFQDPGICFYSIPDLMESSKIPLKEKFANPLDPDLYVDLKNNLYQSSGFVYNFFHDIFNEIWALQNANEQEIQDFLRNKLTEIEENILRNHTTNYKSFLEVEYYEIDGKVTIESLFSGMQKFCDEIIKNQLGLEKNKLTGKFLEVKTIYISNKYEFREKLVTKLHQLGVTCLVADSFKKAKKYFGKHKDIGVIIIDFRYYDQQKRLTREQGYHIPKLILQNFPGIYDFILLTDFETSYLPKFINERNTTPFSKEMLVRFDLGYAKFAQLILEKHVKVSAARENLPEFGDFAHLYEAHVNAKDFEIAEHECSSYILGVIDYILNNNGEGIKPIENPSGKLNGKSYENNLKNFRNKLKGRRLALAICQLDYRRFKGCNHTKDLWGIIYSIIHFGQAEKMDKKSTIQSFVNRHLFGLKTTKNYHWKSAFDYDLTIEERNWLIEYGNAIEFNDHKKLRNGI